MSTPAWLALAATLSGVVAILGDGRRGVTAAAVALGLGGGGLASLAGGPAAFLVVLGPCLLAALAVGLGGRVRGAGHGRPGPLPGAASGMFGARALRVAAGVAALLAARWLAAHLAAVLVVTPVPVFSCDFLWEVGIVRVALARSTLEIGLGVLTAAVATAAFLILGGGSGTLAVAALALAVPAGGCVVAAVPGRGRAS